MDKDVTKDAWENKEDYRILLDDSSPLRPLELVAAISLALAELRQYKADNFGDF